MHRCKSLTGFVDLLPRGNLARLPSPTLFYGELCLAEQVSIKIGTAVERFFILERNTRGTIIFECFQSFSFLLTMESFIFTFTQDEATLFGKTICQYPILANKEKSDYR